MSKNLKMVFSVLSVVVILTILIVGAIGVIVDMDYSGLIQCVIAIMMAYCSLSIAMRLSMLPKQQDKIQLTEKKES